MQTGSVIRHGRGWRGQWREDGRRRSTETVAKKGEARRLLNAELDRLALGAAYRAPITFDELCDRFLAQHDGQESIRARSAQGSNGPATCSVMPRPRTSALRRYSAT